MSTTGQVRSPMSGDHLLLLHATEQDRREGLAAWVNDGLARDEVVVYTEPEDEPEERTVLSVLRACGVDVATAKGEGRLVGCPPTEVYRPDGLEGITRRLLARGFRAVRMTAEHSTPLTLMSERCHLAVEFAANDLCREFPLSLLCQCRRSALSPPRLDEIAAAHLTGIRERQLGTRPYPGGLGLSGEIDLANEDVLASVLRTATVNRSTSFSVDLSGSRSSGWAAVRVLEESTRAFRDRGGLLLVVSPVPAVAQVLELLGFDRLPGVALTGRRS